MAWRASERLMETIRHYASFPATGVSLRQMVQFGDKPSTGTLFRASQFLSEELPIRLAHRVRELGDLPDGLNEMPSIKKVQDWYAQSFEEITKLERPKLTEEVRSRLLNSSRMNGREPRMLEQATPNPSIKQGQYRSSPTTSILNSIYSNGNSSVIGNNGSTTTTTTATNGAKHRVAGTRRYFVAADDGADWPPELIDYNSRLASTLDTIKRRHDSVVTTVAQGVLEWKRKKQRLQIDSGIQAFLDRFYMSRIGIRMLIGQHIALTNQHHTYHPNYVGIICTKTNVRQLAQEAIDNARFVCEDHYGLFEAPKVQLVCRDDLDFIHPAVWTYMYTTVDQTPNLDRDFNKSDFKAPMAGFGYGLPISRLYARYFGGDLKLISMEGRLPPPQPPLVQLRASSVTTTSHEEWAPPSPDIPTLHANYSCKHSPKPILIDDANNN
ncbi:pyruvate dehydrogenase kinase [Trichophyton equinum CBS 127.97]|uniref:Protein-serine/threonine kinase n=1 Tax=Trichophyton equinum (strain ATCC MYA-4606 / CBS 127.97) TaxID=559882 RepID=F2Q3C2_TRIEC|nr:pyruvate dehydrogenase kinase [Trichophyton equinum CBS 127.97]